MAKLCGFGQISLKFTPTSAIRSAPSAGQQRRRRAIAKLCGFGQISLKLTIVVTGLEVVNRARSGGIDQGKPVFGTFKGERYNERLR